MRLIDADTLLDSLHESLGNAKKWEVKSSFAKDDEARTRAEATIASFTECCLRIKAQPTIDAVEVVRCKDCKYYDVNLADGTTCFCTRLELFNEYDWFCADGERRDPCSSQDS
jgi:hypothetical protein